jgi:hypothetical protein
MRFSLKWILLGMAYMAVAAAAFTQTTWVYADLLWAASLLAVVYAALVAAFARGRRQMAAAGFVAASVCFLACVYSSQGNSLPTTRLLAAAGVGQSSAMPQPYTPYYAPPLPMAPMPVTAIRRPVQVTTSTPNGPVQTVNTVTEYAVAPAVASSPATATWVSAPPGATAVFPTPLPYVDFSIYQRAGNAVGMMLLGGLGCVMGLMAHRAIRREQQS